MLNFLIPFPIQYIFYHLAPILTEKTKLSNKIILTFFLHGQKESNKEKGHPLKIF